MITYQMPKGVEHWIDVKVPSEGTTVITYQMPKGVEHKDIYWYFGGHTALVITYQMPKGVEHAVPAALTTTAWL